MLGLWKVDDDDAKISTTCADADVVGFRGFSYIMFMVMLCIRLVFLFLEGADYVSVSHMFVSLFFECFIKFLLMKHWGFFLTVLSQKK